MSIFPEWSMDTEEILEWVSLQNIVTWTCSLAMMVGGVVPYIPQYREIRKTDNADGFSTYVCLVLLVANTLRIIFWFGHPFELPLLCQSIIMNVAMLAMIHLCICTRNKTLIVPAKARLFAANDEQESQPEIQPFRISTPRSYWDFDLRYFWEWTDFLSYLEFLATFSALVGILMYLCIEISPVVEGLGFLALFIEAMLGAPQFYKNLNKKSTLGMSKKMVSLWCAGDVFKTAYFVFRGAPVQFWVCGCLQVLMDLCILGQVLFYRTTQSPVKKAESHIS